MNSDLKSFDQPITSGGPNILEYQNKPKMRPLGITILAILAIIGALISIFSFVSFASFSIFIDLWIPLSFIIPSTLIATLLIVFYFLIAYGFWKGLRWSWFLAIILLIVGIVLQIVIVVMMFFMMPYIPLSTGFDFFYFFTIVRVIIFVVIYSVIVIYLTRLHVKTYFGIGQSGDIKAAMNVHRKKVYLISSVFIIIALILIWGYTPTGEIKLVNLIHTPENPKAGDRITITAEITGGSPFGGAGVTFHYCSYLGESSGTGSRPMTSVGDNKYTSTVYGGNGSEIWYMICKGNTILADQTVHIDHVERSNITTLVITNLTQIPELPTSDDSSIVIEADISSNVNISSVYHMVVILGPTGFISGSGGGGSSRSEGNFIHTGHTIRPYGSSGLSEPSSYQGRKFESGTKIYYRIAAKDILGNTAVVTKSITIS